LMLICTGKGRRLNNLLDLKLQHYNERIRDIFKANRDGDANSDNESEDESKQDSEMQVKISRLGKVLKDIKHLIGLEFSTWEDYITGNKSDFTDRIKKVMWNEVHKAV